MPQLKSPQPQLKILQGAVKIKHPTCHNEDLAQINFFFTRRPKIWVNCSVKMALETNILAMTVDLDSTHLSQLVTKSIFYTSTASFLSGTTHCEETHRRRLPPGSLSPIVSKQAVMCWSSCPHQIITGEQDSTNIPCYHPTHGNLQSQFQSHQEPLTWCPQDFMT